MSGFQSARMKCMGSNSNQSLDEYCADAYRYNLRCSFNESSDDSCGTESANVTNDDESACTVTSSQSQCSDEIRPVLRFNDYARVREFAVTVGDAACCEDSCPITLDWCFVECKTRIKNKPEKSTTSGVRRLTIEQRRRRIALVQGWTNQTVKALENERVLQRMEDVTQRQDVFVDSLIENDIDNQVNICSVKKETAAIKTGLRFEALRDWDGVQTIKKLSSASCVMNGSQRMEDRKWNLILWILDEA